MCLPKTEASWIRIMALLPVHHVMNSRQPRSSHLYDGDDHGSHLTGESWRLNGATPGPRSFVDMCELLWLLGFDFAGLLVCLCDLLHVLILSCSGNCVGVFSCFLNEGSSALSSEEEKGQDLRLFWFHQGLLSLLCPPWMAEESPTLPGPCVPLGSLRLVTPPP